MPLVNVQRFAKADLDAAIARDSRSLTRKQRRAEAEKLAGQSPPVTVKTQPMKTRNVPVSAAVQNNYRANQPGAQHRREGKAVEVLLHQTMEPVSADLARIPVVGFMPTVGTALARTVDTYSTDYSKFTAVQSGTDSHMADRNGKYAIQNDLGVEPLVFFRDAVVSHIQRTFVEFATPPSLPTYTVDTAFIGTVGTGSTPTGQLFAAPCLFVAGATSVIDLPTIGVSHKSGSRCYGDTAPGGMVKGKRVIWLDAPGQQIFPTKLTITLSARPGQQALPGNGPELRVTQHHSEFKSEAIGSTELIGNDLSYTGDFSFPSSGYFSFDLAFPSQFGLVEGGNINYLFETLELTVEIAAQTCYQHVMPEAVQGKEDIIRKLRVNGASALIQNTSAEQARGGTVYATQLVGDVPWFEAIADPRSISNHNTTSRYVGDWSKGFYGFVKPQGTSPMELLDVWDDLDDPNITAHLPLFRPFQNIGTIVVLIEAPTPLTGTFSPTQYTLHVIRAYEFTTNDQFFDVEAPHISISDYDAYVEALATMPQFYENPLHLAAIAGLISRAATLVARWGPTAVQMAKMFIVGRQVLRRNQRPHQPGAAPPPLD